MTLTTRTLFAIGLSLVALANLKAANYLPPSEVYSRQVSFIPIDRFSSKADLEYQSEAISIKGTAILSKKYNTLKFSGTYSTKQEIEPGMRLGFQVYSENHTLLLLDGNRSEFHDNANEKVANFDYDYTLERLNVPPNQSRFYIKFNYVIEGKYWADIQYPSMELPAFRFKNVNHREIFKPFFSYFPTLIPIDRKVYSIHLFNSYKSKPEPFNHVASIEARYIETDKFDDNKRHKVKNIDGNSTQFLIAQLQLNKRGAINRRLGFVWDGIRWYKLTDKSTNKSYVIPFISYFIIGLTFTSIVVGIFYWSATRKTAKTRRYGFAASGIASIFLLLEFLGPLLPVIIATIMVPVLGRKLIQLNNRLYWTLLALTISTDLFWTLIIQSGPTQGYASAFSLFMASVMLAPFALVKRQLLRLVLGNLMLVAITSYYMTMSFYYFFFEDYPTLNVLTYATQGTDLLDSISTFIDGRFIILGIIVLSFGAFINMPARD